MPYSTAFGEIERDWLDNEPPGLFPTDQSSLWGIQRAVYADYLQGLADTLAQWYINLDPSVVDANDIGAWEEMLNVPVNMSKGLSARRSFILSRRKRGAFTRTRRKSIIEDFLAVTFGNAIVFNPSGMAFEAGGTPMYSGSFSLTGLYAIRENLPYGTNLLANGNFETNTVGWTPTNTTLTRITTQSKWGTAALQSVATAAGALVVASAPISGATAGRVYTDSIYIKGTGSTIGKTVDVFARATGGASGTTAGTHSVATLTANWQRIMAGMTLVQNDRTGIDLVVQSNAGAAGDTMYLDGAQVELAPVASSFVDTAKTPFYYEVRISNTSTPDMVGLLRELTRLTPAGIAFDVLSVTDV